MKSSNDIKCIDIMGKNMDELSSKQQRTLEHLNEYIDEMIASFDRSRMRELEQLVWDTLTLFQKTPFSTAKNLTFTYEIRGGEMFVDRKEKSITRSTLAMALEKAIELQQEGGPVTGPKKLGVFGASYLYPVFIRVGIIRRTKGTE